LDIYPDDLTIEENNNFDTDKNSSSLIPTTTIIIESIDEDIIENVTKPLPSTTTIINEKQVKSFLTQVNFY
jgi:hypothetical protein